MNWLRQPLSKRSGGEPRVCAKPTVEQLETRNLLSRATLAVASGIVNSPEDFTNFVTNEYATLLRRAPDSDGLNHWVSLMESGMSPEAVEAAFALDDPARAGSFARLDPALRRTVRNDGSEPASVMIISAPTTSGYEPMGWA